MPETTVHKNCKPRLPENKVGARAEGRAALLRRPDVGAARQHGPATNLKMPPPAGDAMRPQQKHERQFRVLVAATPYLRHHFRPLRFGEHVRHFFLTTKHTNDTKLNCRNGTLRTHGSFSLSASFGERAGVRCRIHLCVPCVLSW